MEHDGKCICPDCGAAMQGGLIELDASGLGYMLSLTGVPAASCRHCRSSLTIAESGETNLDALILATVEALESLAPIPQGEMKFLSMHCRKCMSTLPKIPDKARGHFRANAYLGTTGTILGVEYYGQSFTCPKCMVKHPHLPSPLYHKVRDSLTRAAKHYIPH